MRVCSTGRDKSVILSHTGGGGGGGVRFSSSGGKQTFITGTLACSLLCTMALPGPRVRFWRTVPSAVELLDFSLQELRAAAERAAAAFNERELSVNTAAV